MGTLNSYLFACPGYLTLRAFVRGFFFTTVYTYTDVTARLIERLGTCGSA